jgi:predicted ATP-dependent serine protease
MAEFDENVQCGNCELCRIDSTDYLGRCSNCGERDWELIVEDKWLSVPELQEMAKSTGQDIEQLKKNKEAFLENDENN